MIFLDSNSRDLRLKADGDSESRMRGSESTSQMKAVNLKHARRWPTAVAWTKGGFTLVDASQDEEALQKSSREFEDTPRLVSREGLSLEALQPW
jgi:hypothetical protein